MSSRLLPVFAAAILITVGATAAVACDGEKSRSANATKVYSAASGKSCGAKSASTANVKFASAAKASKTNAVVASASTCQVGKAANAVFASADAKSAHCATAKAAAVAAGKDCCAGKSAAVLASSSEKSCSASKSASAVAAMANASNRVDAVLAGSQCKGNSVKASKYAHSDCESCSDWSACEGELAKAESQMQVIPLKNGVMYVFTSIDPNNADRVQAVLSSRNNRVKALMSAGDQATLCGQCKAFRGAIASGNLTREVVNIEGGSLMIMTSPDRQMVNQLYSLAGLEATEHIEG